MAPPKKVLDKAQKPPPKRIRKTKPPLKIPSIISIKIPSPTETVPEPAVPIPAPVAAARAALKQHYAQIKLDLANEVARAQLVKSEPVIFDEPKEQVVVRKRGRRKKVVSDFLMDDKVATEPQTKKPRKVLNKKVIPEKTTIEKATPKKRQADSTVKRTIKRRRLTPQADTKANETEPITRRITRRTLKGKQEDITTAAQSPSILTGYDTTAKPNTSKKVLESKSPAKELSSPVKGASLINSRKTSLNSTASSGQSWVRDISSTSTTTCVTVSSNDLVSINGKLPVIKLTNIDNEVCKYKNNDIDESSSSDSDSDSSDSEHKYSEQLGLNPPKLSASSSTSGHNTEVDKNDKMVFLLDKLNSILKKFDMEIINGLRFDTEEITGDVTRLKDKLVNVVNNEFGIINHCKHVRRILDPQSANEGIPEDIPAVEANKEFSPPNTHTDDSKEFKDDLSFDVDVKNIIDTGKDSSDSEPTKQDLENFTADKFNYIRFDQGDDDDALSLYAESLTGIESSRMNSSIASVSDVHAEEYTPQPVKNVYISPEKYVYCPTKIDETVHSIKPRTVCEKQNADSTSIYREATDKHEHGKTIINDKPAIDDNETNETINQYKNPPPGLMSSQFKPINVVQSVVFNGVCFFNLINSCKKSSTGKPCRFLHADIDPSDVKERLAKVNEQWFIQEYITMRSWPKLRRKYGMCFVNECVRRELTRILVEMALDFVKKANASSREDSDLKFHVAETTLLHLNIVGLSECEDLLKYYVCQGTKLCDFFIETIAHTQNFSRFKQVFVSLVSYMVTIGRTFGLLVASCILERVCILPYDEGLAKAVLKIIKHTDPNIFENSMIRHYEKQISCTELFEEYMSVKRARQGGASPERPPAPPPPPPAPTARPDDDAAAQAPSPDTTDYDNMNKKTNEPIITRILDFTPHVHNPNVPPTFASPNASQPQRVIRKSLPFLNNWKPNLLPNRQHFGPRPHFGLRPPRPMGTPLKRPQRLVTYAGSPTRYTPRRPGPHY